MTFDLGHTIGNRKKRFLSYFYAGQLKTRKTIYGQSSLSTDRVGSRCLFCSTQKAFFYDWFCCRSLEFQKEISRKRSHKNYLKHRFNARQIYELCALMSNFAFPTKIGRFYIRPQVAQARNMSIGEHRYFCVTFENKDLYGKKTYRFCNLRK